jgi:hypothetical protein
MGRTIYMGPSVDAYETIGWSGFAVLLRASLRSCYPCLGADHKNH